MNFIEFLKEGSLGAYWRVTFDGKNFKKEGDTFPEFVVGSDGVVYEKAEYGCATNYLMRNSGVGYNWLSWVIISKSDYQKKYTIEVNVSDHYVTLKEGDHGNTIHSYDDLNDSEDEDEENTSISSYNSYDDVGLGFGRAILSILFPPFILIWAFLKEYENYYFKKWAYMLGSFICGGESVCVVSFSGFLEHNTAILGVFSVYAATFFVSLIVLCFSKHIGSKFKSTKQIVVFSVIYSIVFVAALVVVPIILSRFM